MNLAEKAQEELTQKEETLSGVIAIGCGEIRSVQEVAKLITGFQECCPLVKFELYSGDNEDIKERMEQGALDMGLLLEPVSIVKYDFIRMKMKEQWGVLIHKDNPLASRNVIQPGGPRGNTGCNRSSEHSGTSRTCGMVRRFCKTDGILRKL